MSRDQSTLATRPSSSSSSRQTQEEREQEVKVVAVMAAERAPSRRKQCLFRRAFQRFPFGKCDRKTRTNSSYEVASVNPCKGAAEKWSPTDTGLSFFNHHQPFAVEVVHSNETKIEDSPTLHPNQQSHEVVLIHNSDLHLGHVPNLDPSSQPNFTHLNHPPGDPLHGFLNPMGTKPQEDHVSPPSPSVSSMDTDVEIDPETGERALD
ncbi:hypothetical protein GDO86_019526 [Hymenochirus boettgeri]|uniref:Uncharacterized protein n=1 Tax=Hymenochirus boettgeri TaxID=247094 RepID=A0A8T2IJ84_9PIPI|nr:hypothetical protein GDO86_019526 [Hymenochirus boettgeri]